MNEEVQIVVREAVLKIIQDTASQKNIRDHLKKHRVKIHFVPLRYRIIGAILQSLNIRFGNFIEKLIALVIEQDSQVSSLPESGKRISLSMTAETDRLIDQYITSRQLPNSPDLCDDAYQKLLEAIFEIERRTDRSKQTITKDVDALFRSRDGKIIYLEAKYNDDHDTGKFVDINRKFLKTYAGLLNHLQIDALDQLIPIIYYFNPTKRYGPIYIPSSNILRGAQLFDAFLEFSYADIDTILRNLGDDEKVMEIFDRLYQIIRHDLDI
ncbi:MAG: TdeIII family type II restriction endonuclease [Chloroflexota bacterium]|nr:TdeIII family type II restriction endonuclease [Chloroflexota bacterium]